MEFMRYDDERRKYFLPAIGAICIIVAFISVALCGGIFADDEKEREAAPDEFAEEAVYYEPQAISKDVWVIYVTGAVMRPGVYEVLPGARVNDAILAAGGLSVHSDPEAINLAEKIDDGVHIKVPEKGAGGAETPSGASRAVTASAGTAVVKTEKADAAGKININKATASELQRLPGIGPVISQAIVDYRDANGAFASAQDIMRVKGIGKKRFETIKDLITVF
jgi:competence protein ComEA